MTQRKYTNRRYLDAAKKEVRILNQSKMPTTNMQFPN